MAPLSATTARSISPGSPPAHEARDPNKMPVGLISNRSARGCSFRGILDQKTGAVLHFHGPVSNQNTIESIQASGQHVIKEVRLIGVEVPHALGPAQPVSASRVHQ